MFEGNTEYVFLIAYSGNNPIGFMLLTAQENSSFIQDLAAHTGIKGLGAMFIECAVEVTMKHMKYDTIKVCSYQDVKSFYEKMGFAELCSSGIMHLKFENNPLWIKCIENGSFSYKYVGHE